MNKCLSALYSNFHKNQDMKGCRCCSSVTVVKYSLINYNLKGCRKERKTRFLIYRKLIFIRKSKHIFSEETCYVVKFWFSKCEMFLTCTGCCWLSYVFVSDFSRSSYKTETCSLVSKLSEGYHKEKESGRRVEPNKVDSFISSNT